jgi:hypothetical protein
MSVRTFMAGILPSFNSVRDRRTEIDRELAQLRQERVDVLSPVLPLDDFIAWNLELVDAAAARGERTFDSLFVVADPTAWGRYLAPIPADLVGDDTASSYWSPDRPCVALLNPMDRSPHVGATEVRQDVFCALLAAAIKPGLERILRDRLSSRWPREVGLSRAERSRIADRLTARMQALRTERAELEAEVREAMRELSAAADGATDPAS